MVAFVGSVGGVGKLRGSRAPAVMKVETLPYASVKLSGMRTMLQNGTMRTMMGKIAYTVEDVFAWLESRGVSKEQMSRACTVVEILRDMQVGENLVLAGMLRGMPVSESEVRIRLGDTVLDVWKRDMEVSKLMTATGPGSSKLSLFSLFGDFPCLVIELAHGVASLRHMPVPSPVSKKTREHLEQILRVHVPLADTMGLWAVQSELEELAFMHLFPEEHTKMCELVGERLQEYGALLGTTIKELEWTLTNMPNFRKVASFRISGRIKNVFSIYRKMRMKKLKFEEVLDFVALRVVLKPKNGVSEEDACNKVMREISSRYTIVEGTARDYISNPKDNGYQSLHATVEVSGLPMEFQVRTERMHEISEIGSACHHSYKTESLSFL